MTAYVLIPTSILAAGIALAVLIGARRENTRLREQLEKATLAKRAADERSSQLSDRVLNLARENGRLALGNERLTEQAAGLRRLMRVQRAQVADYISAANAARFDAAAQEAADFAADASSGLAAAFDTYGVVPVQRPPHETGATS